MHHFLKVKKLLLTSGNGHIWKFGNFFRIYLWETVTALHVGWHLQK